MDSEHRRKKVTVLGPTDVGKTSLIYRMKDDLFQTTRATVGVNFSEVKVGDFTLEVWDTAGQERYSLITPVYLPKTFIFILAFDLSRPGTLNSLASFATQIRARMNNQEYIIYLIGNKSDIRNRELVASEICDFRQVYGIARYFEVSAKTGEGILEMMIAMEKDCLDSENAEVIAKGNEGVDTSLLGEGQEAPGPDAEASKGGCCVSGRRRTREKLPA